jgi:hypothetical protein
VVRVERISQQLARAIGKPIPLSFEGEGDKGGEVDKQSKSWRYNRGCRGESADGWN